MRSCITRYLFVTLQKKIKKTTSKNCRNPCNRLKGRKKSWQKRRNFLKKKEKRKTKFLRKNWYRKDRSWKPSCNCSCANQSAPILRTSCVYLKQPTGKMRRS